MPIRSVCTILKIVFIYSEAPQDNQQNTVIAQYIWKEFMQLLSSRRCWVSGVEYQNEWNTCCVDQKTCRLHHLDSIANRDLVCELGEKFELHFGAVM